MREGASRPAYPREAHSGMAEGNAGASFANKSEDREAQIGMAEGNPTPSAIFY